MISQSTSAGSGSLGIAHMTELDNLGDNLPENMWDTLTYMITSVLDNQNNGVGLSGFEACIDSFNGEFNDEVRQMCIRSLQLSAFLPIVEVDSRLADADDFIGKGWTVHFWKYPGIGFFINLSQLFFSILNNIRNSFLGRLPLTPTLYNLAHTHRVAGAPIIQNLFEVFPSDSLAKTVNNQFMFNNNMMIVAVNQYYPDLTGNFSSGETFPVYLPPGRWTIEQGDQTTDTKDADFLYLDIDVQPNANGNGRLYDLPITLQFTPVFYLVESYEPIHLQEDRLRFNPTIFRTTDSLLYPLRIPDFSISEIAERDFAVFLNAPSIAWKAGNNKTGYATTMYVDDGITRNGERFIQTFYLTDNSIETLASIMNPNSDLLDLKLSFLDFYGDLLGVHNGNVYLGQN